MDSSSRRVTLTLCLLCVLCVLLLLLTKPTIKALHRPTDLTPKALLPTACPTPGTAPSPTSPFLLSARQDSWFLWVPSTWKNLSPAQRVQISESRPGSNTPSFMRPLLTPVRVTSPPLQGGRTGSQLLLGSLLPSMHGWVCDGAAQGPACYPQSTCNLLLPHKASSWFPKAQSSEGCFPRKTAVPGTVREQEQGPGLRPVSGHSTPSLSCQRQKQGTDNLKSGA